MYDLEEKEKESRFGKIIKVSGPLFVAERMSGAKMYELVKIGWSKLVGEVIKLEKDTASIQCYEDTSGLTVGDPVLKMGSPLAVQLGPGPLSQIFDGIQRPLKIISKIFGSVYVPRGVDVRSLDMKKEWPFIPSKLKVGSIISGGDVIGIFHENDLFSEHKILLPPKAKDRIIEIQPSGNYAVDAPVIELHDKGEKKIFNESFWAGKRSSTCTRKNARN